MKNETSILPLIAQTLHALETGDHRELDLANATSDNQLEQQILDSLRKIQGQNLHIEEILEQCVIGNYSVSIEESHVVNRSAKLINKVLDRLRGVVKQANIISQGDYSAEVSPQSDKDELGIALFQMTRTLRAVAEVSLNIAAGDLSNQVEMKGEQDYLAQAINQMIGSLREMARQAKAIAEGDYTMEIGPRSERDELARSIDKMMKVIRIQLAALQQSNQGLSEFAHVASHDLNAPLCKIKYSCDLLRGECEGKLSGNFNQLFDVIIRSCDQMIKLIRDLLEHASIGGSLPVFSEVDLKDLVDSILSDLSPEIEEAGARVIKGALPVVFGERTALLRLFQNLITNALKYRGKDPLLLEISEIQDNKRWILSIKDNGIGIAPPDHEKIFAPFVRLHTTSSIPGTGIGLATCDKIAKQLGGKIWVDSELGRGSTFFVSLPKPTARIGESVGEKQNKKKILLVDDDKDQLLILASVLEKGNFEIEASVSPEAGLNALRVSHFDLVISDVQMPHLSGAEFISAIRFHSNVPILMLTSSGPEREQELRALGANDFLTKKDAFSRLMAKVVALLGT